MIHLRRGAFSALALTFLLGAVATPYVQAQETPAPVAAPDVQTRTFRLQYVQPSLAAFWLDPAHQPMPDYIRFARGLGNGNGSAFSLQRYSRLPGNGNGPPGLELPFGISSIRPIDAQISLIARGTAEGLAALEKLLPTLDVALVQYDIEADFYEVPRAELSGAGLKFSQRPDASPNEFGSVALLAPGFKASFQQLLDQKRAKLITAPRILVLDGLSGEMARHASSPVLFDEAASKAYVAAHPVDEKAWLNNSRPLPQPREFSDGIAYITTKMGFGVTALHQPDNMVTLALQPVFNMRTMSIVATVREDQTFAIQMSPSTDATQLIIVVTPRRVRRAGDDN